MLAVGNKNRKKPLVYFVGLSAKPMCEHLSPKTRTGDIIEQIIYHLPPLETIKTNLVKTPPLDKRGKLRYPNENEMKLGWKELRNELYHKRPFLLVTLGLQVSCYLRSQLGIEPGNPCFPDNFFYKSYLAQYQSNVLSVHHPSFIFVYRRKYIDAYVKNVAKSISYLVQ